MATRSPLHRPPLARWRRAGALLLGAWLGLSAVPTQRAAADPLRIAMPDGPVSLPLAVAFAKRFFDDEGVDAARVWCPSGKACLALLRNGGADLATSAEFAVAMTAAEAPAVAIVASLSSSSDQLKVLASRAAGIQAPADVAGKRVAVTPGTSAEYFLDRWLTYQGIDPRRVTTKYSEPGELASNARQKYVDAVVVWEPEATRIEAVLGDDGVRLPAAHVYEQNFCLIARRQAIEPQRAAYEKVLRVLLRAQRFIAESPADARSILAAQLKLPPEVAGRLMAEQAYRLTLHASLPTTMLNQARWRARAPRASEPGPAAADVRQLIDASLLKSVAPAVVTLTR